MKRKVKFNESTEEKETITNENLETIENITNEIIDDVTDSNNEPVDEPVDEPIVKETAIKEGKVSCAKLNVRSDASKDADIVFVIVKDNVVSILDDSDEVFYKISYDDNEGYCMKEFIELL